MYERRLSVGDRVRISASAAYRPNEWVTVEQVEGPSYRGDLPYYVKLDGESFGWWPEEDELDLSTVSRQITLSETKAAEVREALQAIGWDDEDLGPLAAPKKPMKTLRALVTLPDDDNASYAREDFEAVAKTWGGSIVFQD